MNIASANFSLVCVLDPSTLFTLPRLEQMWAGPISVALFAPVNENQFKMLSTRTRTKRCDQQHADNPLSSDRCWNDRRSFSAFRSPVASLVPLNTLDGSHSPSLLLPLIALLFRGFLEGLSRERSLLDRVLSVPISLSCRLFASLPRSKETIRQLVAAKKVAMRRSSHVCESVPSHSEISLR